MPDYTATREALRRALSAARELDGRLINIPDNMPPVDAMQLAEDVRAVFVAAADECDTARLEIAKATRREMEVM